jgi:hypothetical protein
MPKKIVSGLMLALLFTSMLALAVKFQAHAATATIPGDLNNDNKVDLSDLGILSRAFGSTPADSNWNRNADINRDGAVSLIDLAILALHFGESSGSASEVLAGWRSSPYEFQQEKEPSYWVNVAENMTSKIGNSVPSGVWILGEIVGHQCHLTFDSSVSFPNIVFLNMDQNEKYLSAFDAAGLKVWLQVEPADANVETLIDLVLQRYQHHSCVIGFGVDVEWLQADSYPDGRAVTNEEAQGWLDRVKSYNPSYQLFLKHWLIEKMPTTHAADIVFTDDSQGFSNINALADEFSQWATNFWPSKVCFQIGYDSDRSWWSQFADPYKTITDKLTSEIPNCNGVYWVDFTLLSIYP